jgi:hypothetical protein
MELGIARLILVGAALVTSTTTSGARSTDAPVIFRVVADSAVTTYEGMVVLIAVKNIGSRRLYLSAKGSPLIWGYAYDVPPPPGNKDPRALGDINSIVRSSSHTTIDGENYCPALDEVMALDPGGELLIPGKLGTLPIKDRTYTVDINCAILQLDGVTGCGRAAYGRGIARAKVNVRKGMITVGPSTAPIPDHRSPSAKSSAK